MTRSEESEAIGRDQSEPGGDSSAGAIEPSERGRDSGWLRLHPYTLLFAALGVGRRILFPAIIGGLSAGGDDPAGVLSWMVGILAVPAVAFAAVRYATFRYRLAGEDLLLRWGLLARGKRAVPLRRIHNLDVRQNALERLFGVAQLRVETAGGESADAVLEVLDLQKASELRDEILSRRRTAMGALPEHSGTPRRVLARLGTRDLILAGATANEAGLVAAGLFGALELAQQLPGFPAERFGGMLPDPGEYPLPLVALLIGGVLALFFLIAWILSIASSIVRYHGYTLEESDGELRARFGLVGRREVVAPLRRIQAVRVEESLLRLLLGLTTVKLETAGSSAADRSASGAEALVPLVRRDALPDLLGAILPQVEWDDPVLEPVHQVAHRRLAVRLMVPVLLAVAVTAPGAPTTLWLLLLVPAGWLLAGVAVRRRGFLVRQRYGVVRKGLLTRITWLIPRSRLQTLHVRSSPMQRRQGVATVYVDTAAGGKAGVAKIVDVDRERAGVLVRELLADGVRHGSGRTELDPPGHRESPAAQAR